MLDKMNNKGKHLTSFDRAFIEEALTKGYPLNEIGKHLGKDPRTISKEIRRNRSFKPSESEFKGGCVNRRSCEVKHICSDVCKRLCKSCNDLNCMRKCSEFKTKECFKLKNILMFVMAVKPKFLVN